MRLTLVPAYGRDYKSKAELLVDWNSQKDFQIQDMSSPYNNSYINRQQCSPGDTMMIRYKKLRSVAVIKVTNQAADAA